MALHMSDCGWCLVVKACCHVYGGCEFESRSLHLKSETKLREETGLSGCRKGLKTGPLAQALLSPKPAQTYIRVKIVSSSKNNYTFNISKLVVSKFQIYVFRPRTAGYAYTEKSYYYDGTGWQVAQTGLNAPACEKSKVIVYEIPKVRVITRL